MLSSLGHRTFTLIVFWMFVYLMSCLNLCFNSEVWVTVDLMIVCDRWCEFVFMILILIFHRSLTKLQHWRKNVNFDPLSDDCGISEQNPPAEKYEIFKSHFGPDVTVWLESVLWLRLENWNIQHSDRTTDQCETVCKVVWDAAVCSLCLTHLVRCLWWTVSLLYFDVNRCFCSLLTLITLLCYAATCVHLTSASCPPDCRTIN